MALRALLIAIALLIAGAVGLATYHYVESGSKPEPATQVSTPAEIETPPVDAAAPSTQPTAAPVSEAPPPTPPTAENDAKPVAAKGSPAKPSTKKAKPKSKPAE